MITLGDKVVTWEPDSGRKTVVAGARAGEHLEGADMFAGGVVLWTAAQVPNPLAVQQRSHRKYRGALHSALDLPLPSE